MSCFGVSNLIIIDVPGREKCAFASRNIEAGEIILKEPPFLLVPPDAVDREDVVQFAALYPSVDAQLFAYYLEYEKMDKDEKDTLFEFYSPLDSDKALSMRTQLLALESGFSSRFDIDIFIKVAMAFHYNGAEVTPPPADGSGNSIEYGVGLYPLACKISHSCDSNTGWYLNEDKWRVVQANIAIKEGEEVTVDYSMGALLLVPTVLRRLHLADHFACGCDRCNSKVGDNTRQFNCYSSSGSRSSSNNSEATKCQGRHIVKQNFEHESPTFIPCSVCGVEAPDGFVNYMLQLENALTNQVDYFTQVLDDVVDDDESEHDLEYYNVSPADFESLACFSQHHHLAYKVASVKYRYFASAIGNEDYKRALEMKQDQIHVLRNIIGSKPSRLLAFQYEIAADLAKDIDKFDVAVSLLEEARRLQVLVSGSDSPYTTCVERELAGVIQQMKELGV